MFNSPQLGDIVAGHGTATGNRVFNRYNTGHAGVAISGSVVVSASPGNGVRVGRFSSAYTPNSGFSYLRYIKP